LLKLLKVVISSAEDKLGPCSFMDEALNSRVNYVKNEATFDEIHGI
jgi:hypothetical protein